MCLSIHSTKAQFICLINLLVDPWCNTNFADHRSVSGIFKRQDEYISLFNARQTMEGKMYDMAFPLLNSLILGSVAVLGIIHLYRFRKENG